MPMHCKMEDPLSQYAIEFPFGLNDKGVPIFECLRILAGTVDIRNKKTQKIQKPRNCHITNSARKIKTTTIEDLIVELFEGDLSFQDCEKFLMKGVADNRRFWEELRAELCLCIVASKSELYVDAFLYLYRIFELVAIALPLVYISAEGDYNRALSFIKSLSNNSRDGELSVFKKFSEKLGSHANYQALTIDFKFGIMPSEWKDEVQRQLDVLIFSDHAIKHTYSNDGTGFLVEFSSMTSFFVSCRNRLFHNTQGEKNFKLDPLDGANGLCKIVINPTLYFLGLILAEVAQAQARRYV